MSLSYIIQETMLMLGFTFIVGIAFAYILKLMTLLFSYFDGEGLPGLVKRCQAWGRAYCVEVAHTYKYIRTMTWNEGFTREMPGHCDLTAETSPSMDGLAEYHFGNSDSQTKQDAEMKHLYEIHHGKI